jgi:hypothetical protein
MSLLNTTRSTCENSLATGHSAHLRQSYLRVRFQKWDSRIHFISNSVRRIFENKNNFNAMHVALLFISVKF